MAGRISGLNWNAGGYMNPDMSPEVMQLLAERGFNPDGTRRKLDAINDRITSDWQAMGFEPSAPPEPSAPAPEPDIFAGANSPFADPAYMPPEPQFGAITRARLAEQKQGIDEDYDQTNALVDALLNGEQQAPAAAMAQPRNPISGMAFNPALPEQPAAPKPPIPRARPAPTSYTIRKGDNPTTIAKRYGLSLAELEAKNPGILKKARRLKVGSTLKV